jgi:tetraacyldisaccharide 4'-kinase
LKSILRILAAPFSWIYALVIWGRNLLYDERILPSFSVSIPTICIGNLAVGGTGKTPMTEYLIRLLSNKYSIAVLSRGYGRSTSGFRLAGDSDTAMTIGDEPMLIHLHFPDIPVAVCANRLEGVRKLRQRFPELQCIILDDAFQHRRIRCGYNILLTSYDKLYVNDHMLPHGNLRDLPAESRRANTVVVTKCPQEMPPILRRIVSNQLQLASYQNLCYSTIQYAPLDLPGTPLIVAGIANPQVLYDHVSKQYPDTQMLIFRDHYKFKNSDVQLILKKAEQYACVLTTEKDYMRMMQTPLVEQLGEKLIVLPIQTDFGIDKDAFERAVLLYVAENNRKIHSVKS